jgi:Tfp pilus assembly protein PilF
VVLALAACCSAAGAARAQDRPGQPIPFSAGPDSIARVLRGSLPMIRFSTGPMQRTFVDAAEPPRGPIAQKPFTPLDPARAYRLRRAVAAREQGRLAGSRDSLRQLLTEVPHHPLLLTELGKTLIAQSDFAGVQSLARAERSTQKDSLLLGRELALAEERLGRQTQAAQVVVEAWSQTSSESEWANQTLARLLNADSRAVREALRRALTHDPGRADLTLGLARLEWRAGDGAALRDVLGAADHSVSGPSLRFSFAEELLRGGAPRDSAAALDILGDVAADRTLNAASRLNAAQRAWDLDQTRGAAVGAAPGLAKALADLPGEQWNASFALALARSLRAGGHTQEARALLDANQNHAASGDLALERALTELRDGPPERALPALEKMATQSPEGAFDYAEGLFFAGNTDSALAQYRRIGDDPNGIAAGAALQRVYLIEDADPKSALPEVAHACYESWRGNHRAAAAIADSLYRRLPRRALWANTALMLSDERAEAGDNTLALAPLLAVADSLPDDRLAPLARQKAGDLYHQRLHDDAQAIAQYELCLTRYPRAWNAPEVRRALERLRGGPRRL